MYEMGMEEVRDGKLRYLAIFRGLAKIQEVIYLNSDDWRMVI